MGRRLRKKTAMGVPSWVAKPSSSAAPAAPSLLAITDGAAGSVAKRRLRRKTTVGVPSSPSSCAATAAPSLLAITDGAAGSVATRAPDEGVTFDQLLDKFREESQGTNPMWLPA